MKCPKPVLGVPECYRKCTVIRNALLSYYFSHSWCIPSLTHGVFFWKAQGEKAREEKAKKKENQTNQPESSVPELSGNLTLLGILQDLR